MGSRLTTTLALLCIFSPAAGCAGAAAPSAAPNAASFVQAEARSGPGSGDASPADERLLFSIDYRTGALESWPIQPTGSDHPTTVAQLGVGVHNAMAADGNTVAVAAQSAAETLLYDVVTKGTRVLPDPYGTPVDVAIDRNHSLYVLTAGTPPSVVMYPGGSMQPVQLVCGLVREPEVIAVDDEGDIFIGAFPKRNYPGVFEIPVGPGGPSPQSCKKLPLMFTKGVTGLTVDARTDDLIVLDQPTQCAPGAGRIVVYPKPYEKNTGETHYLHANCPAGLKLSAASTIIFYGDTDASGGGSLIRSSTYPAIRKLGTYSHGAPLGLATIPNELPN